MSIEDFPEMLSQAILVRRILIGRLGVLRAPLSPIAHSCPRKHLIYWGCDSAGVGGVGVGGGGKSASESGAFKIWEGQEHLKRVLEQHFSRLYVALGTFHCPPFAKK